MNNRNSARTPRSSDCAPETATHGMSANPIATLIDRWLHHADFCCRVVQGHSYIRGSALRDCAAQLQAVIVAMNEEKVSLKEGARRSGYSSRQLSLFISEGRLRNHGTKARPKVAVRDLPRALGLAGDQ